MSTFCSAHLLRTVRHSVASAIFENAGICIFLQHKRIECVWHHHICENAAYAPDSVIDVVLSNNETKSPCKSNSFSSWLLLQTLNTRAQRNRLLLARFGRTIATHTHTTYILHSHRSSAPNSCDHAFVVVAGSPLAHTNKPHIHTTTDGAGAGAFCASRTRQ